MTTFRLDDPFIHSYWTSPFVIEGESVFFYFFIFRKSCIRKANNVDPVQAPCSDLGLHCIGKQTL